MKKNKLVMMFMLASAVALSACDQKKKEQPAAQENAQEEVAPVAPESGEVPAQVSQQAPAAPESSMPESSETMAPVPEKPAESTPESTPSVDVPAGEDQASQTGN